MFTYGLAEAARKACSLAIARNVSFFETTTHVNETRGTSWRLTQHYDSGRSTLGLLKRRAAAAQLDSQRAQHVFRTRLPMTNEQRFKIQKRFAVGTQRGGG